ncbi:hypothetical protein [Dyella psychrodurans]|uniref:Phasin domain-containing protein n=1 Tax=Dyella psychrodurans TaxID=1927960 RepID=A0A370XEG1_9GAMM|nr:hypothetical protein [Dyella psychrodurans]RDS86692.1 hypothetical protein DWU99_05535 [Dyella psychrodurans]
MPVTAHAHIPFELYKANLQFTLRTSKLLKECGQHWLSTFGHAFGENVAATQEQIEKISLNDNWYSLATIPNEAFLRLTQASAGDESSIAKAAVINRTRFLTGMQDAFSLWQRDTTKAVGHLEAADSLNTAMADFFNLFNNAANPKYADDH